MVRRHSAWARSRMRRSRPKTPAPKSGWVISELSQITGIPVRRLRDYVFRDLIQPLERRGTATRYPRSQLVRVMAIKRMRAEEGLNLDEIKRRMDAMGERELEAWIAAGPLPSAVLQALGLATGQAGTNAAGAASSNGGGTLPWPGSAVAGQERAAAGNTAVAAWYHVQLLPGLVLQFSATASPAVKSAAKRICDEYLPTRP